MFHNKWLIGVLVISLVANLALGGFLLGRTTSNVGPKWVGPDPAAGYFRLIGFMPEERREEFHPLMRQHFESIREEIGEMREHLRGFFDELTAESFDRDALAEEMAELRRLHAITQEESHRWFVELVSQLTLEERRQMAQALRDVGARLSGNGRDGAHEEKNGREPREEHAE